MFRTAIEIVALGGTRQNQQIVHVGLRPAPRREAPPPRPSTPSAAARNHAPLDTIRPPRDFRAMIDERAWRDYRLFRHAPPCFAAARPARFRAGFGMAGRRRAGRSRIADRAGAACARERRHHRLRRAGRSPRAGAETRRRGARLRRQARRPALGAARRYFAAPHPSGARRASACCASKAAILSCSAAAARKRSR